MKGLYSELTLKNLKLKNRIVMPPMCTYSSYEGFSNSWHSVHYGTRAVGGVGLIILEATAVTPEGRISDEDLGLWSDLHVEGLKKIVDFSHEQGTFIAIQLAHAGRKSEVDGLDHYAPSEIRFSDDYDMPIAMSKNDITYVIQRFKESAERALKAGFDMIEVHGAHGYLINEFLSPLTNIRHDEYGGSLENRTRFLVEIIRAIRSVWPEEKVLMLRISADEYDESGNTLEDFAKIIGIVKDEGIDIIDVSSGGVLSKEINTYPGYQLKHGAFIKKETGITTLVGGLITNVHLAEEIIQNDRADLVYFGRELLRNPYFPIVSAKELNIDFNWPIQYERAKKK